MSSVSHEGTRGGRSRCRPRGTCAKAASPCVAPNMPQAARHRPTRFTCSHPTVHWVLFNRTTSKTSIGSVFCRRNSHAARVVCLLLVWGVGLLPYPHRSDSSPGVTTTLTAVLKPSCAMMIPATGASAWISTASLCAGHLKPQDALVLRACVVLELLEEYVQ